jgi:hypothetical protein
MLKKNCIIIELLLELFTTEINTKFYVLFYNYINKIFESVFVQ